MALSYNLDPTKQYEGPDFEEYCISEGRYLPANRDRSTCIPCPLFTLCQPGFEEQVRRIQAGENPSLTEGCGFPSAALARDALLTDLTSEQQAFVLLKVPGLRAQEDL